MVENNITGKYYPGKGFYHKCAYPERDNPYFFGRKNKLFLIPQKNNTTKQNKTAPPFCEIIVVKDPGESQIILSQKKLISCRSRKVDLILPCKWTLNNRTLIYTSKTEYTQGELAKQIKLSNYTKKLNSDEKVLSKLFN